MLRMILDRSWGILGTSWSHLETLWGILAVPEATVASWKPGARELQDLTGGVRGSVGTSFEVCRLAEDCGEWCCGRPGRICR